jgi:hypothetical protein
MSQKRMFDRAIIDTDKFMDMSMASKALYFLLGMDADDEGFVSYKKVMRVHGGNEDDFRILILKNFLIPFASGVVVITDWNKNNYLDKNRIKPTEYQTERKLLSLTKSGEYVLNSGLTSIEESRVEHFSAEAEDDSDISRIAVGGDGEDIPTRERKKTERVDKEILQLFDAFKGISPEYLLWRQIPVQRDAARALLDKYGLEKTIAFVEASQRVKNEEFAPQVYSPYDLLKKLPKLKAHEERRNRATN